MATTNAQLALQITRLLTKWNQREAELASWMTGATDGGPNGDGRFPLTDASGNTVLALSVPKLEDLVAGPAALSDQARLLSEAARDAAVSAQLAAAGSATTAQGYANAAGTARDYAQLYRDEAAASAAGLTTAKDAALGAAASAEAARDEVLPARDETLTARDEAVSAAATVDTSNFLPKTGDNTYTGKLTIDGEGRTNIQALVLTDLGEGAGGFGMSWRGGGSFSIGNTFGPVQIGATNRPMHFTADNRAYNASPFGFLFHNRSASDRHVVTAQHGDVGPTGDYFRAVDRLNNPMARIRSDGGANFTSDVYIDRSLVVGPSTGAAYDMTFAFQNTSNYSILDFLSHYGGVYRRDAQLVAQRNYGLLLKGFDNVAVRKGSTNETIATFGSGGLNVTLGNLTVNGVEVSLTGHSHSEFADFDARLDALEAGGGSTSVSWNDLLDKPATFAPSAHTHAIGEVTGLQGALDAKLASASFTWANLGGKPSTFAPSAHTHAIGEVTGLQTALDGKQAAGSYASSTHNHDTVYGKKATVSTAAPSGGVDGDVWYKV